MCAKFVSCDARPIPLVANALSILHSFSKTTDELSAVERRAVRALVLFRDALSQREQTSALKALAVHMRQEHPAKRSFHHQQNCLVKEETGVCLCASVCPLCSLASSALSGMVLESANVPFAISNAALRAVLRVDLVSSKCETPHILRSPFLKFLSRLDELGAALNVKNFANKTTLQDMLDVDRLVRDLPAICAFLGEPESKNWIFDCDRRILLAVHLALMACHLFIGNSSGSVDTLAENHFVSLETVLDSALKVLQETCRFILNNECANVLARSCNVVHHIKNTVERVLATDGLSQRCIKSCAVAFVTATNAQHKFDNENDSSYDLMQFVTNQIETKLCDTPPLTQLALIRAIVEAPSLRNVDKHSIYVRAPNWDMNSMDELSKASHTEATLGMPLLDHLCRICVESTELSVRFAAMECIILCLRQLRPGLLTASLRESILNLIQLRWQEPFPNVPSQMRDAMDALIALDDGNDLKAYWNKFAIQMLDTHLHSVGMYPPLSRLVRKVGALALVRQRPAVQANVMKIVRADSNAAKPIADWLEEFWSCLLQEIVSSESPPSDSEISTSFLKVTALPLVAVLMEEKDFSIRERVSSYIIPAYLRSCSGRQLSAVQGLIEQAKHLALSEEESLQLTVVVLSVAKRVDSGLNVDRYSHLRNQIQSAVRNCNPNVRLMALELILSSHSTTEPLSEQVMEFVVSALPVFLYPGSTRGDVNRFQQIVTKFLYRVAESHSAALVGGGWWAKVKKKEFGGDRRDLFDLSRTKYCNAVDIFLSALSKRLLAATYPGGAPERRRASLEMLSKMASTFGIEKTLGFGEWCGNVFLQPSVVEHVLNCVGDAWRPSRVIALELACHILPSTCMLVNHHVANKVMDLVSPYLHSPRLSEAAPAANICRFVFRKSVLSCIPGSTIPVYGKANMSSDSSQFCNIKAASSSDSPVVSFISSIADELESRLCSARLNFAAACDTGLFFGDIRFLRECIEDSDWTELCVAEVPGVSVVRQISRRVVSILSDCAALALQGLEVQDRGGHNTNSTMQYDVFTLDADQKIATSCHLSVKEICLSLGSIAKCLSVVSGCLRKISCLREVQQQDRDIILVLEEEEMRLIGGLFDMILRRVRHNGVVKGAAEGYEQVCREMLQSPSRTVQKLPEEWALKALHRALNGEVSALRRSAGVPYHILSVARAEVNHGRRKATYSPTLNLVFEQVLGHLHGLGFSDSAQRSPEEREVRTCLAFSKLAEITTVHCMNVLRFLFLDSYISRSVTRYLARCTIMALQGFRSNSWMVRNSAFMLFSAIVRRGIGTPGERHSQSITTSFEATSETSAAMDGKCRIRGVTAVQFFSKYPELHPFLLSELEACVKILQPEDIHSRTNENVYNQHALFPVLYLLSSLSPSVGSDQNENFTVLPFNHLINCCLSSRSSYVRRVAASACVPLVRSTSNVASEMETSLIHRLPERGNLGSRPGVASVATNWMSQNMLHGELLRIAAIMKGMQEYMTLEQKLDTVTAVAKHLGACTWIATDSNENSCCVTRVAMLRFIVLCAKLVISMIKMGDSISVSRREQFNDDSIKLLDDCFFAARACLFFGADGDPVCAAIPEPRHLSIAASDLYKEATTLLKIVVEGMFILGDARVKCFPLKMLLKCPLYEVRGAALECCPMIMSAVMNISDLWNALCEVICEERQFSILCVALQAASDIVAKASKDHNLTVEDMRKVWDYLVHLSRDVACVDVREAALRLLGGCATVLCSWNCPSASASEINDWMCCVQLQSSNPQLPSSRRAALESLRRSRILCSEWENCGGAKSQAETILIRLLQDDVDEVRQCAVHLGQQAAYRAGSSQCLDALPTLFVIHENLEWSESRTLSYLEDTLDLYDVSLFPDGVLHALMSVERTHVVAFRGTEDAETDLNGRDIFCDAGEKGFLVGEQIPLDDLLENKLFRDDSNQICSEPSVLAQLALWAVKMFSVKSSGLRLDHKSKQNLQLCCVAWTVQFAFEVKTVCKNSASRSLINDSLASTFLCLHQMIARIVTLFVLVNDLACFCDCAIMLNNAVDTVERAEVLHPSLVRCIRTVAKMMHSGYFASEDLPNIFFLIQ